MIVYRVRKYLAFSMLTYRHIRLWHTIAQATLSTLFQMQKERVENANASLKHINSRMEGRNKLICLCSQHSVRSEIREEEPQSVSKAECSTELKQKKWKTQPCDNQHAVYSITVHISYSNLSGISIMGGVSGMTWINHKPSYLTLYTQ